MLLGAMAVVSRWLLDPWLGESQQVLTLFGAVVISLWLTGVRGAVVTAICGFIALDYFIIPPRNAFAMTRAAVATALGSAVTCAMIIGLAEASRRARRIAQQHEQQSQAERRQREHILDTLTDGFYTFDAELRCTYANPAGLRLARRSWPQLQGQTFWDIFPEARPLVGQQWERALRDHVPVTCELFYPPHQNWYEQRLVPAGGRWTLVMSEITERKRAEEARFRLAAIVESSSDAILSVDVHGLITSWNRGAEILYGYTAGEILGQKLERLIPPDCVSAEGAILERIMRGETLDHYETVRQRRDGSTVMVALTISPIRDDRGTVVGASKIARDITQRKRADEASRRSEATLRTALDAGDLGAWEWNIAENSVTWTDRVYEIHGVPRGQFAGTREDFLALVHPEDRPRVQSAIQQSLQSGTTYSLEFRVVRPNGDVRWLLTSAQILPDAQGRPERMIGVTQDITERKLAEDRERLLTVERVAAIAKFRAVFDQAAVFAGIMTIDGRLVEANRLWLESCGYRAADVIGKPFWETPWWRGSAELQETIRRASIATANGQSFRAVLPYFWADGTEHKVAFTLHPVRDEKGTVIFLHPTGVDITDRIRTEEALRASEARFRGLMEQAPLSIQLIAPDGRTLRVNHAWEHMWGLKIEQLDDYNILHDPQLEAKGVLRLVRRAFAGDAVHIPAIHYNPDETIPSGSSRASPARWVSAVAYPLKDDRGRIWEIAVIHQDITERKQAEDAMRESEERLRLITDNVPALISYIGSDLRYRFVNAQYFDWFHRTREELIGRHVSEVIGHDAFVTREPHMRAALAGEFQRFESQTIHHRLGLRHSEVVYVPDRAASGEVRGVHVFVHDVHDRKVAEESLRESERRFRQLADAMPQLVWTANSDGRVDYYNERLSSYSGATWSGAGKWDWAPLLHPEDVAATRRAWEEAVQEQRLYSITHRVAMADGTYRWHLSRATPVRDSHGTIVKWFGTATDIDDQKRAEERLEAIVAQRTAKLRETVAELDAFSYSIAHDMRAPLRSMSGYASLLRAEYSGRLDTEGNEFLRRITASAQRLDRLIQDVLNYSKIVRDELVLEPVAFGALALDIIQSYPDLQEPNATIVLRQPLPTVQANPAALTQVIANLLGNAVKFVPPGVKPSVVVRSDDLNASRVRIWFEDNGIGIAEDAQQRIFGIFQRLHRPDLYQGTGIGLSIVRKAIERMGGQVGVESAPGKGSRFWIELTKTAR